MIFYVYVKNNATSSQNVTESSALGVNSFKQQVEMKTKQQKNKLIRINNVTIMYICGILVHLNYICLELFSCP